MSQSRRASAIESAINVVVGFGVAIAAQVVVFPLFGVAAMPMSAHLGIGSVFTVVSLARSYALRRLFNLLHTQGVLQ